MRISKNPMLALFVLTIVQGTFAQNFNDNGRGIPYESFTCVQPKQRKLTTFFNVLSTLFSGAQGLSGSRRFNQGLQVSLMVTGVGQSIQASRASPSLICYVSVPTNNYEAPSNGRIP